MSDLLSLHRQFCDFSLTFKSNTPRTIKWYRDTFRRFQSSTGVTTVEQFDRRTLERWVVKHKLQSQWSAKTVRNYLQALGLFADWLVREDYLAENPVAKIPRPKLPKKARPFLSVEDARDLLNWTRNYPFDYAFEKARAVAIIATFLYTGIRLEELRKLELIHVDLEQKTVFVKQGKCQKDRLVPFFGDALKESLEEYLRHRRRLGKQCPYFFTAMRQDSQMGEAVVKRLVKKLREASGIYFYPHMLRHTFATLMLQSEVDIVAVQELLGHASIQSTLVYVHMCKGHLDKQVRKYVLNSYS